MFFILVQVNLISYLQHLTIHPDPYIAIFPNVFKYFNMFTLTSFNQGGQNLHTGAFRHFHQVIHYLLHSLL